MEMDFDYVNTKIAKHDVDVEPVEIDLKTGPPFRASCRVFQGVLE